MGIIRKIYILVLLLLLLMMKLSEVSKDTIVQKGNKFYHLVLMGEIRDVKELRCIFDEFDVRVLPDSEYKDA